MWITDPDGIRIVLVEVSAGHPLRRDPRPAAGAACKLTRPRHGQALIRAVRSPAVISRSETFKHAARDTP
jgi:hypothetical protein